MEAVLPGKAAQLKIELELMLSPKDTCRSSILTIFTGARKNLFCHLRNCYVYSPNEAFLRKKLALGCFKRVDREPPKNKLTENTEKILLAY
jgi:hypothetical protein